MRDVEELFKNTLVGTRKAMVSLEKGGHKCLQMDVIQNVKESSYMWQIKQQKKSNKYFLQARSY